jgi:pyrroline-5-carboxylate reductase
MKIGFIGCGNMASAIIYGMHQGGFIAQDILISDVNKNNLVQISDNLGVISSDNQEIARSCEIVILAIKPQNTLEVANEIKDFLNEKQIIVSILAGISTTKLKNLLGVDNLIRVMPNTPAQVSLGASAMFALRTKNEMVERIFNSVGKSFWLENEEQIDVVTALSGSGPAYFYLFFELMVKTATQMGLAENIAKELCLQTAVGAATMAQNADVKELRANVTSKGGTTEVAINTMLELGLENLIKFSCKIKLVVLSKSNGFSLKGRNSNKNLAISLAVSLTKKSSRINKYLPISACESVLVALHHTKGNKSTVKYFELATAIVAPISPIFNKFAKLELSTCPIFDQRCRYAG